MILDLDTHLGRIVARSRLHVQHRQAATPASRLERAAEAHTPRGFARNLRAVAQQGTAIIAELKKASPSKGLLRPNYEPAAVGASYQGAGAAAISVLTETDFFQGSLGDLQAVSAAVSIPVLRKDFMVDAYQVVEARAAGADAILLIVAALDDGELKTLAAEAARWGLDVLCEVHDREELKRAVGLGFPTIGVNSRDLKTLEVHPRLQEELLADLPQDVLRVAESGIRTPADIDRLLVAGYDAFLVGEALMRQPDPAAELALLIGGEYSTER